MFMQMIFVNAGKKVKKKEKCSGIRKMRVSDLEMTP